MNLLNLLKLGTQVFFFLLNNIQGIMVVHSKFQQIPFVLFKRIQNSLQLQYICQDSKLCLAGLNWFIGCLGRKTCIVNSSSAQTSLEGIKNVPKLKQQLMPYCLIYILCLQSILSHLNVQKLSLNIIKCQFIFWFWFLRRTGFQQISRTAQEYIIGVRLVKS